ncbi:hypothetical protein [Saccharospirillum sp.]|uniref:hypothetical protein n=1 Tax=Saccharospirillum sp. TaxID=2033801 RepID=UPI00349FF05B
MIQLHNTGLNFDHRAPGYFPGRRDIDFNLCQKNSEKSAKPLTTGIDRLFKESPERQKNAKKWVDR